jgi:quercetin dioxygenase-like cupin family protein
MGDPAKLDPKHYKVEFESDRIRVLRVSYGAREKSVMHTHPEHLAFFLTEAHARYTFPDGRTEERWWKIGETKLLPAEEHLPENLSDKSIEFVLVELKKIT